MFIERQISKRMESLAKQFPVIGVIGPRQSGKTTLVKQLFSRHRYVTLEDVDMRMIAQEDPRGFFATYSNDHGMIIDEIQVVPELLSYMQGIVDEYDRPGYFVLTGSQNFLMYEKITQTLAGRIAFFTLLPLSIGELQKANLLQDKLDNFLWTGGYPRIYDKNLNVQDWLSQYVATYVERDVRQLLNISNVLSFQKFIKLCAARVGNLINYAELARDADISPNTAKAWISILETSYIIKLLPPYYRNFNKRIIKSPKLYFYDTGLVCYLLGIKNAQDLALHSMRGAIFETLVISELYKYQYNQAQQPHLYFWRDVQGHEIDCLIEKSLEQLVPIEIKSGMTINKNFFRGLVDWQEIAQNQQAGSYVVYAGDTDQVRQNADVTAWQHMPQLFKKIFDFQE